MRVVHVVGARPNFMKVAPVWRATAQRGGVDQSLVHTGQHYDVNMSDVFFTELGLPAPDHFLGVGSGTHAAQTAKVMLSFEQVVTAEHPDWVLVYGDVNSTLAATLTAAKLGIPVAHVEAGLRSGDRRMPEELNRLATDHLADLLLTPSADADENLRREGIPPDRVRFVGNVMIDTLVRLLPQARWPEGVEVNGPYALATLHRPANVDDPAMLRRIISTLDDLSRSLHIVFPIHPRTTARMAGWGIDVPNGPHFIPLGPLGYLEFLALQRDAAVVVTDSGGIQEETTFLGVPCLTVRENTERPITVTVGTNRLIGQDMALLKESVYGILRGEEATASIPPLWDGRAGERIAEAITTFTDPRASHGQEGPA